MPAPANLLNHVAVLCRSVDRAAEHLVRAGFRIGPRETWDGEGTAEIYVGPPDSQALLLLVEPLKDGAYRRAMEKRGPGLHHIAIDVPDLDGFVDKISSSGWLLHPKSLESLKRHHTLWLSRPGFPALIEVQSRDGHAERLLQPKFISRLLLPVAPDLSIKRLLNALQVGEIQSTDGSSDAAMIIEGTEIQVQNLATCATADRALGIS